MDKTDPIPHIKEFRGRQIIDIEGCEVVQLVVRNIGGIGVLFTADGKMIGHQVAHIKSGSSCPHYFYDEHDPDRMTMFRATFMLDGMKDQPPK